MDPKPEPPLPPTDAIHSANHGADHGADHGENQTTPNAPPRVLLVEDDAVNRILSSQVIQSATGLEPDTAWDGEEAVELASAQAYDLILMDLLMPGMDGVEATRRIRALPGAAARCPIVALSATNHPSDVQRCLAAGMNAHLLKPLLLQDLRAALKRWV